MSEEFCEICGRRTRHSVGEVHPYLPDDLVCHGCRVRDRRTADRIVDRIRRGEL